MTITPLGNQVIVLPAKNEDWQKTSGGVLTLDKAPFHQGRVVSISQDVLRERENQHKLTQVKAGDTVWYEKGGAREVESEGVKYHILPYEYLVAIV